MRVAILSPHRDDAAFSCGLTMLALLQAGAVVTVLNVFTRSDYAVDLATVDPALVPVDAISRARRVEDERFVADMRVAAGCAIHAMGLQDADMLDAPLRLSVQTERVLESPLTAEQVHKEATSVLAELGVLDAYELVFAPLALGDHIDHRIVRNAAVLGTGLDRLCLYEDLPYAARLPSGERKKQLISAMESNGLERFGPVALHMQHGPHLKKRFAMHYPSQIAESVADEMSDYGTGLSHAGSGAERWWATPAAIRTFAGWLQQGRATCKLIEEQK